MPVTGSKTFPFPRSAFEKIYFSPTVTTFSADVTAELMPRLADGEKAEPLLAPRWFDCFDAKQISRDISAGTATAGLIASGVQEGIDEYIALYPDGDAFIWRQLSPEYAEQ